MGCISEKSSERRVTSFPMKDLGGSGRSSAYADRSADAPVITKIIFRKLQVNFNFFQYSGFRKFILGIYIVVIIAITVALIVITALAPIEQSWNDLRNSMKNAK
jgi:hypothetical protein